jgi:hypothetical protein
VGKVQESVLSCLKDMCLKVLPEAVIGLNTHTHTHTHTQVTQYALNGPVTTWVHGIRLLWVTFFLVSPFWGGGGIFCFY